MPRGDVRIPLLPPIRGIRFDFPKHLVPDGYFSDGQNVLPRNGVTLIRPGMSKLTAAAPGSTSIMGGIYYKDNTQTSRIVAASTTDFFSYSGAVWSTITGSALTGTASDQIRFSVFPFSTTTRVVAVNDKDAPQVWPGSGNFAALGGSPPIAKTVTTAFQRMILGNVTISGTRRGSSLWISGFQDPTLWPAVNQVDLPDTGDVIVDVRALNNQVFAIYKENSVWVGIGAASIFPFVFDLRAKQPGPVSPYAVVEVENSHYYLANDGSIYRFDGNAATNVGTRIRGLIQTDVDWSNKAKVHGFYDSLNREIWWFWPSLNNAVGFNGLVYRLPYEDYPDAFSPLQSYSLNTTSSWTWNITTGTTWNPGLSTYTWNGVSFATVYPTWTSFTNVGTAGTLVGGSTGDVYQFGQTGGDSGNAIAAFWELPLRPLAGDGENMQIDVIESFFKKAAQTTNVNIVLVTSDTLNDSGTQAAAQAVDISSGSKLRASYYNTLARYVAVRHSMTGSIALNEYRGGMLYVYRRQEA